MAKRVLSSVQRPVAARALPGLLALGLVLLQLVTALHFALIPHALNAGLSGFEHVHRALESRATERAPDRPSLVTGVPTCAPDACPLGFSGPISVLFGRAAAAARVAVPVVSVNVPSAQLARCRNQLLLSAPKTSPPRRS